MGSDMWYVSALVMVTSCATLTEATFGAFSGVRQPDAPDSGHDDPSNGLGIGSNSFLGRVFNRALQIQASRQPRQANNSLIAETTTLPPPPPPTTSVASTAPTTTPAPIPAAEQQQAVTLQQGLSSSLGQAFNFGSNQPNGYGANSGIGLGLQLNPQLGLGFQFNPQLGLQFGQPQQQQSGLNNLNGQGLNGQLGMNAQGGTYGQQILNGQGGTYGQQVLNAQGGTYGQLGLNGQLVNGQQQSLQSYIQSNGGLGSQQVNPQLLQLLRSQQSQQSSSPLQLGQFRQAGEEFSQPASGPQPGLPSGLGQQGQGLGQLGQPGTGQTILGQFGFGQLGQGTGQTGFGQLGPGGFGQLGQAESGLGQLNQGLPNFGQLGQPGSVQAGQFPSNFGQLGQGQLGLGQLGQGFPNFGQLGQGQPGSRLPGQAPPDFGQIGLSPPGFGQVGQGQPGFGQIGQGSPAFGQPGQSQQGYGLQGQGQTSFPQGQTLGEIGLGQLGFGQPGQLGFGRPGQPGFSQPEQGQLGNGFGQSNLPQGLGQPGLPGAQHFPGGAFPPQGSQQQPGFPPGSFSIDHPQGQQPGFPGGSFSIDHPQGQQPGLPGGSFSIHHPQGQQPGFPGQTQQTPFPPFSPGDIHIPPQQGGLGGQQVAPPNLGGIPADPEVIDGQIALVQLALSQLDRDDPKRGEKMQAYRNLLRQYQKLRYLHAKGGKGEAGSEKRLKVRLEGPVNLNPGVLVIRLEENPAGKQSSPGTTQTVEYIPEPTYQSLAEGGGQVLTNHAGASGLLNAYDNELTTTTQAPEEDVAYGHEEEEIKEYHASSKIAFRPNPPLNRGYNKPHHKKNHKEAHVIEGPSRPLVPPYAETPQQHQHQRDPDDYALNDLYSFYGDERSKVYEGDRRKAQEPEPYATGKSSDSSSESEKQIFMVHHYNYEPPEGNNGELFYPDFSPSPTAGVAGNQQGKGNSDRKQQFHHGSDERRRAGNPNSLSSMIPAYSQSFPLFGVEERQIKARAFNEGIELSRHTKKRVLRDPGYHHYHDRHLKSPFYMRQVQETFGRRR